MHEFRLGLFRSRKSNRQKFEKVRLLTSLRLSAFGQEVGLEWVWVFGDVQTCFILLYLCISNLCLSSLSLLVSRLPSFSYSNHTGACVLLLRFMTLFGETLSLLVDLKPMRNGASRVYYKFAPTRTLSRTSLRIFTLKQSFR